MRHLAAFFASALLLSTAAPGRAAEPLTVLAYETPPFFQADGNRASGLEYEILEYYAKKVDRPLRVRWVRNFDEILPMLARGEGDIAAATLTITPERESRFDFTTSYFPVRVMLVEPRGRVSANVEALRGAKVATMRGTTYEDLAQRIPGVQLVYGDSEAALFDLVSSGEARAATADSAVALSLLSEYRDLAMGLSLSEEQHYGFAVAKGSPLARELTVTINQLKTSNIYYRLLEKHLGAEAVRMVKAAKGS